VRASAGYSYQRRDEIVADGPEQRRGDWGQAITKVTDKQRQRTLMRWLDWRWRDDYVCFSGDGEYSATRLDDRQAVVAGSVVDLQRKIEADYSARPVDRSAVPGVD
jgi:hypothetical protein